METEQERNTVLIKISREDGFEFGGTMDVNAFSSKDDLNRICRVYEPENINEYNFYIKNHEIVKNIQDSLNYLELCSESIVEIICKYKSLTPAETINRCSSSLPGHSAAIITLAFSPDSQNLVTGSGDTTIRLWDMNTETPVHVLEGHKEWILALAWSYDCKIIASGDKSGTIILWDVLTGKQKFQPFRKHKKWITYISWEPLNLYNGSQRFASSSKDGSVIVWNASTGTFITQLNIHIECVSCVRWSGTGLIYSSSHDLTISVWKPDLNELPKFLKGHSHWVNYLAINSDYIIRSSCYDNETKTIESINSKNIEKAKQKFESFKTNHSEIIVSCSDDATMIMWKQEDTKYVPTRLTGHRAPINQVVFSSDGRFFASASFDKSIKLWDGNSGKFLASFLGHVSKVYQLAWSPSSRMLISTSADSTLKMWDVTSKKLIRSLDGHSDEVYTVDWTNDGTKVASGSKDGILKIWRQ